MPDELKQNQYECAVCRGIFDKGWSDEEAKEELQQEFPGYSVDDCDIVCENCYKLMGFGHDA